MIEQPRQAKRTPRARRHAIAAALVAGYLSAAVIALAVPALGTQRRWLAVHLLGLGAASNAVLVWSRYFAQGVLHLRPGSERAAGWRLLALNAGVVGVLVGMTEDLPALAAAGAATVVVVVAAHAGTLAAMVRSRPPGGRLRVVVAYYLVAAGCLVVAGSLGGFLAGGAVTEGGVAHERLHLAHAELNLLGWLGLTVLGTLVVLWPTALRTRMTEQAPALAASALVLCGVGLAVLTAGALAGARASAAAGSAVYAAGVAVAAVPLLRTLRGRAPRNASGWLLGGSVGWLFAGAVVDTIAVARTTDPDAALRPLVTLLGIGLVGQALVGALTFLLPVTLGGGPAGNRRLTAILERGWPFRVAAGNLGLLLVVLPGPRGLELLGWAGVLTGFASFLPLAVLALRAHLLSR